MTTPATVPADVIVLYSTDAALTNPGLSKVVRSLAANDNTVHIPVAGLRPNTRYYYATRITAGRTETGRTGTFRTPPPDTQEDNATARRDRASAGQLIFKTPIGSSTPWEWKGAAARDRATALPFSTQHDSFIHPSTKRGR